MTNETLPEKKDGFQISEAEPAKLALAAIKRDEALICRARGVNAGTVKEYAEAMKAGATFPPVVVFRDAKGVHLLGDGFHRCAAAELAGLTEIAVDVRPGGRREALLHAAKANAEHGLRRTNQDKRRAVELVLKSFPKWSDRKIGDACGVDGKTVANVRSSTAEIPHEGREGSDGRTRNVPAFDLERETARAEKALAGLAERWPADERPRFYELVTAWLARAAGESRGKEQKRAGASKAKKKAKGGAKRLRELPKGEGGTKRRHGGDRRSVKAKGQGGATPTLKTRDEAAAMLGVSTDEAATGKRPVKANEAPAELVKEAS